MISVYLVEDHDGLREDTAFALNAEGLLVRGAANSTEFFEMYNYRLPDIAVIDRMLPGEDGMAIARWLRANEKTKKVGIIFLTALGSIDNKLEGLELADAYLVKPVDMRELAAVIRSVSRHINSLLIPQEKKHWRILPRRLELISPQGKVIDVSHKDAQILRLLAEGDGEQVSARKMVEVINENWLVYEKNRLELLLSRLRQKIRSTNELAINPIKSARNEGYLLTIPLVVDE